MIRKFRKKGLYGFSLLAVSALLVFSCSQEEIFEEAEQTEADEFIVAKLTSSTIQAENYDAQKGIQKSNGGSAVGYIDDGDYIVFEDFDYDGANSVSVQGSSNTSGGTIQFRAGSATGGDLLGEVTITNTDGWTNFREFTGAIDDSSNNSDLYLVFKGDSGSLFDVDSFSFSSSNNVDEGGNLAPSGTATQSSNYDNSAGLAELAIDGNTNGKWSGGSVTHTRDNSELDWWQVKFSSNTLIEEVVLWNRTDNCCISRLSNFDVFIYNSNGSQVFKKTYTVTPNPSYAISTGGVTGDRVRIKQRDTGIPLSLAEVQIFGEETGTPPPGGGDIPSDLMPDCGKEWKITYPDGEEDKTLCGEPNNEYFFVNNAGNGIVFRAPILSNNGTTPNSDYIRSELREREEYVNEDGDLETRDIYWTTSGTNVVYVKQAITNLPNKKDHLVATQIHGNKDAGIDDAMVLRLEGDHLFLSFNGSKLRSNLTIKRGYNLGTTHEVIFEVKDGKHYCYYSEDGNLKNAYANGSASSYLVKDGSNSVLMDIDYGEAYFKIGNYTQSNADEEDTTSNNYGEVVVYDFYVTH